MERLNIDTDDLVRKYQSGISEKALSEALGISRPTVRRQLLEAGVEPRGRSAAMFARHAAMTAEERKALAAAAHSACRGRKKSKASLCKRAQTIQTIGAYGSKIEKRFDALMREQGNHLARQVAIGPYNCDFAAPPIAVEVLGGQWHSVGKRRSLYERKIRYLLDHGWNVILVLHDARRCPIGPGAADYVATYLDFSRSKPATVPEYRVIGGAGKEIARGSADGDEISLVGSFALGRNARGQYTRVPR